MSVHIPSTYHEWSGPGDDGMLADPKPILINAYGVLANDSQHLDAAHRLSRALHQCAAHDDAFGQLGNGLSLLTRPDAKAHR